MGRYAVIRTSRLYGSQDTMHSFDSLAKAKAFGEKQIDVIQGIGYYIHDRKTRRNIYTMFEEE
jgi:hypothetical protein